MSSTSSSDSDSDNGFPTPTKKAKVRYNQRYSAMWEKNYCWLKKSAKGEDFGYCSTCVCDLKIIGGKMDLLKHASSKKHLSNAKGLAHQPIITSMLPKAASKKFIEQVKAGEIKMTSFLAEHNLPFLLAGHLKSLMQESCPDSKIAAEFTLERTKAKAILTNVTGKAAENDLVEILKQNQFALIVDESTDKSKTKHLALLVRATVNFKIEDRFLTLIPVVDGTATTLYNKIVQFFKSKDIPYKTNLIAFAADGANTMFGEHHSLAALLTKDIPQLFKMKCICHSFHLCCSYACQKLPRGVEDFARDVYNYIQNSPKRTGDFKNFQEFVNVQPHRLLHPSQTRWLSLLQVVQRLLEQLPALKLYFQSAVLTDRLLAAQSILDKCTEPTTELYLEFLSFVLPFFNDLNKEMQSEQPKLHTLFEKVFTVYKTLLECLIKPACLELTEEEKRATNNEEDALEAKIINIDIENEINHQDLEDIYFGGNITATIIIRGNGLSSESIKLFRQKCLDFYKEAVRQVRARFPFQERKQLKSLKFLNPENLLDSKLKRNLPSIAHVAVLFPALSPRNVTELDREWRFLRNIDLPFSSKENVNVADFWRHISNLKKGDGSKMFPILQKFVQSLLCLPHSSANVERLFSAINLLKTKVRNRLSTETIKGLLYTKSGIESVCYAVKPTDEQFKLFNSKMYDKINSDTNDSSDSDIENQ